MERRSRYSIFKPSETYYTKGKEYSLNGQNYIGEYHISNDKPLSGPIGSDSSQELTEYYASDALYTYDKLYNFQKIEHTFKEPLAIKIVPQETDYELGYYTRYFLQNIVDIYKVPIEINEEERQTYGQPNGLDSNLNVVVPITWTLVGPMITTKRLDGTLSESIADKNEKAMARAVASFPNFNYAVKNYIEFARPTIV